MKNIYHYNTHSEQRYFTSEMRGLYDIISLNGNIVAHSCDGIASFLASISKPFYIDPQTHAFQHPTINLKRVIKENEGEEENKSKKIKRYEFKSSVLELANKYLRGLFANVISRDAPLIPNDFKSPNGTFDNKIIQETCENVRNFQMDLLGSCLSDEDKELLGGTVSNLRPEFVIAPYFYLSPVNFREWLEITMLCYKATKAIHGEDPVYLALVISKDLLGDDSKIILSSIEAVKPDGIILWIDEQDEEKLTESEMQLFIDILKSLRKITTCIYNSHGGYLSVLLAHPEIKLLDGVGHSVNYGESRSVVPIGGGIPMARFYLFPVHSRLRWADVLNLVSLNNSSDAYKRNVCSCKQCVDLIQQFKDVKLAFDKYGESFTVTFMRRGRLVSHEFPTNEAKTIAAYHYLFNKKREIDLVVQKDFKTLIDELNSVYNAYSSSFGDEIIGHMPKWVNILRKL